MADINQGVNYEITAEDKTKAATDSALANLILQEKAAKEASKRQQEEAKKTQGLFSAITAALSGNFEALGKQLAVLVAKMNGVKLSGMALGAVGLAVTGVVAAVGGLVKAFQNARAEADELEKLEFDRAIGNAEEGAKEFADQMARARQEAEFTKKVFEEQMNVLKEEVTAQNELARQRELAMAKNDDERGAINKKYQRLAEINGQEISERQRDAELEDAENEIDRLEKELSAAKKDKANYNALSKGAQAELNALQNQGGFKTFGKSFMKNLGFQGYDDDARMAELNARADKANEGERAADKLIGEIEAKIREQELKIEKIGAMDEVRDLQREAKAQEWQNEDYRAYDDKVAQAEERHEEHMAEVKERNEAELQQTKLANVKELEAAEKAATQESAQAHARLAAAQSAVRQAWGWYRNKDAMKAQLEEEKLNAEAERQFEKDFAKLKFDRDWREAKNLSVDQEAVRRVALAKEEEQAAEKSLASIDQKMGEAVEALKKMTEEA